MIFKKLKFIRFLLTSADIFILSYKGMEISLSKYKTRGFLKNLNFLKEVFAKMKGGAYGENEAFLIVTNFTSICCVYQEKNVKIDLNTEERSVHTNSERCNIQLGS